MNLLTRFMFKKVISKSPIIYLFLAFIAMSGLSYINFLPGFVSALAGNMGFSDVQAGQIVAVNGYGGLLGSIVAIFCVRRIAWQRSIFILLTILIFIDLGALWIEGYRVMLVGRFFAGMCGGLSVGIAFSVLARLNNPDRAFGLLLFVQFSIGSLVIYLLPGLEMMISPRAVFWIMASLSLLGITFLFALPLFDLRGSLIEGEWRESIKKGMLETPTPRCSVFGHSLLLLLAIMAYQTAASGIWAYVGLIGLDADISSEHVSRYIATTGLLGLFGALLPIISGNRFGRLHWLITGVLLSVVAVSLLSHSSLTALSYVIAMALLFFSWPAVLSFLLAVTAEVDGTGRLSTMAAVVSSVGMASGPLLASSVLGDGDFSVMLYACTMLFLVALLLFVRPVKAHEKTMAGVCSS